MNNQTTNPFQIFEELRDSIDELTRAINGLSDGTVYAGNLTDQIGWVAHQLQEMNNANKAKELS